MGLELQGREEGSGFSDAKLLAHNSNNILRGAGTRARGLWLRARAERGSPGAVCRLPNLLWSPCCVLLVFPLMNGSCMGRRKKGCSLSTVPQEMRISPGACGTGGIPSSSHLPCVPEDTWAQCGGTVPPGTHWILVQPQPPGIRWLLGSVLPRDVPLREVGGNHGDESPFLAGPQGHHVGPWGEGSWIMAVGTGVSHFVACRGRPRAGSRWGGLGGSQPLSPLPAAL